MKFQYLLIASLWALTLSSDPLFKLDLSEGLSQFEDFQPELTSAKIIDDEESGDKVLTFEELTRYGGIVTTEWIESESEDYYITISYRGAKGKRTGAFLGYVTREDENTVRALALDNDQKMDYGQLQFFETGEGSWKVYQFYLSGHKAIKLILEKGMYFGLIENYEMAFKKLSVMQMSLPNTDCTTSEKDKIYTNFYFAQIFQDNNFLGVVHPEFVDNGESLDIKYKFPDYQVDCILTTMFAIDADGKAIEGFKPAVVYEDSLKVLKQTITLSELNDYGCEEEEFECNDGKECVKYTCNVSLHFYYDYEKEFTNREAEYEWVNENSQAIFKSQFTVLVIKETQTLFNSLIQTLVNNQICADRCKLDLSLTLQLKVKFEEDDTKYVLPQDENKIVWGKKVYFEISSDPSDYYLSIMDVYIQTEGQTGDEYTQLGDLFINSFIENVEQKMGATTFSMRMSGEAGLSEGKKFNVKFLMKSEPASRRLLTDDISYQSDDLPTAQKTNQPATFVTDEKAVVEKYANQIQMPLVALLLLFCLML